MKIDVSLRIFVVVCFVLLLWVGCASASMLVVNQTSACTTGDFYCDTIQKAVDMAEDGDTIVVCPGMYRENIKIDKRLTVWSANEHDSTIVQAKDPNDHVFEVTADYVNISGFTVQGATGSWGSGLYLYCADYCTISNNNCSNNTYGIRLYQSNNNSISNNNCSNNRNTGIHIVDSNENTITDNNASNNEATGVYLNSSNNNLIIANEASNNFQIGVSLSYSNNNVIRGNIANSNFHGISLTTSNNNDVINNNASNNIQCGIPLWHSSNNNTIRGNTATLNKQSSGIALMHSSNNNHLLGNKLLYNCVRGIRVYECNNNIISKNIIYSNEKPGIRIEISQNNDISDNIINANFGSGIVFATSENNTIVNNIISSNLGNGLEFQTSEKNNVFNNFIDSNYRGGIGLHFSNSTAISGNTFNSNYYRYGVSIGDSSDSCILYHNNIIINRVGDSSLNNSWNDSSLQEGNYWSDYDGADDGSGTDKHAIAGDGIGDTEIPYPNRGYDFYPFMNRDGWLTMSIWPHYLDFGEVYQGTKIKNQSFTITNYGNSILNISSLEYDNKTIEISDTELPLLIAKGSSRSFNITLNTEKLEGFILKNIEIISNDLENPHKNIPIFGFVEVHTPDIEIKGVDYQSRVIKGQINLFNVTITNTGDFREKNVTIDFKAGNRSLGSVTISNIEANENKSAIFKWDTSDVAPKTYDITIEVKLKDKPLPLVTLQVPVKVDRPSAAETLIITNKERLAKAWSAERAEKLENELIKLSYHVSVAGVPVYIEEDEAVAGAYKSWDLHLQDPQEANNVAQHIKDLIDDTLIDYTGIRYIVIVGDDRIIPFYRIFDHTDFSTEKSYDKLINDSTVGFALSKNTFLTDNFYAADEPVEWRTTEVHIPALFIPNIPVSRLVETPEQISAVIDAFYRGVYMHPEKIFVSGYDFMYDTALHCSSTLEEQMKTKPETIVSRSKSLPLKEAREKLFNNSNDVILIFYHATHYQFAVPDPLTAEDFATAPADLNGSIVYTMSCHSGLNVPPGASANDFDLVEAFAQKGVVAYTAPTGYGIGSYRIRAAHELLLSYFTNYLGDGIDVGTALTLAKREYWANRYDFSYVDEKVLETTTLYGLPMVKVIIPHNATSHNVSALAVKSTLEEEPDTLTIRPWHVLNITPDGDYYIYHDGELYSYLNKPILPKKIRIFHPTHNSVLRGAVLHSSKYHVDEPFKQLVEGYEISDCPSEPVYEYLEDWFPARIFKLNSIDYPGPFVESRQYLVIITAQYKGPVGIPIRQLLFGISDREVVADLNSDLNKGKVSEKLKSIFVANGHPLSENVTTIIKRGDNEWTIADKDKKILYAIEKLAGEMFISEEESGIERIYDELSFDLYYASPDSETDIPMINNVSSTKINGNIRIAVNASDESGIQRVLITYTDSDGTWGAWRSEDCKQREGDMWTCTIHSEEEIEFFVQVVDVYGNVAVDDNDGEYYPEE